MSPDARLLRALPDLRWWALLAAVIAAGFVAGWAVAAGVLFLALVQIARPLDFLTAFLLLVAAATFIDNTTGGLTRQLAVLSVLILLMLVCYTVSNRGRALSLARAPLVLPVAAFLALSLLNAARGVLLGHSPRYIGLEMIGLLSLGSSLLVANTFERARHLRWALAGLVVVGIAATIHGIRIYEVNRTHGAGYTMAAPGLVGVLLVNLALRARSPGAGLGFGLLAVPMFVEQFLTFGRGLWTGCAAALAVSILLYTGFGRGSGPRWKRAGAALAVLVAAGAAGAAISAVAFEQEDLLHAAWDRVRSTFGTELGYETRSNLIRIGEYLYVWDLIRQSPIVGHGVGFAFTMKQVISLDVGEQWYAHQYFLFVWLKQGAIGLGLFLWMLAAAVRLGAREARRRADPLEASWFATSAAATVFLAVLSLSNFPFGVVNEMFLLALLWGGAMAMTRSGFRRVRWSPPARGAEGTTRAPGPSLPASAPPGPGGS